MKRKWLLVVFALVAVLAFAACKGDTEGDGDTSGVSGGTSGTGSDGTTTNPPPAGQQTLNVWAFTPEVPDMITRYMELNPDFATRYNVNTTIIATDGGGYQLALDTALQGGGNDAPHLFVAEAAFVVRYTQGDMARYALPFADLGIEDLQGKLNAAQIAQYTIDIGSRDGNLVGLAYQATGSAVIYRRSIAQAVWGTDDPDVVASHIGPGWDKFLAAAEEVSAAGYSMVSGAGDVWQAVRNTGGPWIVNGALDIHPDRMAMFDYAHTLYNNNLMNDAAAWGEAWFADMSGTGARPAFCFLGPAWLINYVMAGNAGDTYGDWAICVPPVGFTWGGSWLIPSTHVNDNVRDGIRELLEWITLDTSDSGLQNHWANGTLFPLEEGDTATGDTVASATVMARANGEIEFLSGQNMFDVFIPAGEFADGSLFTQYDEDLNSEFIDRAMDYARGDLTRDDALAAFRTFASEFLGLD